MAVTDLALLVRHLVQELPALQAPGVILPHRRAAERLPGARRHRRHHALSSVRCSTTPSSSRPTRGRCGVAVERCEDRVRVLITDRGAGFAPEMAREIFRPVHGRRQHAPLRRHRPQPRPRGGDRHRARRHDPRREPRHRPRRDLHRRAARSSRPGRHPRRGVRDGATLPALTHRHAVVSAALALAGRIGRILRGRQHHRGGRDRRGAADPRGARHPSGAAPPGTRGAGAAGERAPLSGHRRERARGHLPDQPRRGATSPPTPRSRGSTATPRRTSSSPS